ncbi:MULTISPECIES: ZIP family metal transporter [unclassified Granulicatella]|uniref:ZIP family metal transporter n=1 Tax=unclassified Granulicatella TaxID=2630493 RepID=UPI001073C562|nr:MULTISPECIES: ZIP family metal transporter [unclassified Granulicatella]MBF0780434.1 ZIP family metal transporter [Granulicatella sp. 19428wC4_WM01]TFU95423.1 ZIP family metal transporter [Granulicatella sp. WM01]
MIEQFQQWGPIWQALIAGLFTLGCTMLGSAVVFFFKEVNQKLLDIMMGFAAGVMIAASFWSLLAPAIEYAKEAYGMWSWVPAAVGFMVGGIFLRALDYVVPHLHLNAPLSSCEGMTGKFSLSKNILLFLAITIHNIPEGLAIGVAFGAYALGISSEASIMGAIGLALGIGLQNIPEGAALSMPIRAEGTKSTKAFWIGSLSAIVEPFAAVLGAVAVLSMKILLPYALSFAAGAMIFVVVEELIPESQQHNHSDSATLGLMIGFTCMMILDVALG